MPIFGRDHRCPQPYTIRLDSSLVEGTGTYPLAHCSPAARWQRSK